MKTLLLAESDVKRLLSIWEVIEAIELARAIQDAVTPNIAYKKAMAHGLGQMINLL